MYLPSKLYTAITNKKQKHHTNNFILKHHKQFPFKSPQTNRTELIQPFNCVINDSSHIFSTASVTVIVRSLLHYIRTKLIILNFNLNSD